MVPGNGSEPCLMGEMKRYSEVKRMVIVKMVENLLEKQIEGEEDEEEDLELWYLEPMAACSFEEEKGIYEIE